MLLAEAGMAYFEAWAGQHKPGGRFVIQIENPRCTAIASGQLNGILCGLS
jgi:hypothetical protein